MPISRKSATGAPHEQIKSAGGFDARKLFARI
jgi:hypothetical protein